MKLHHHTGGTSAFLLYLIILTPSLFPPTRSVMPCHPQDNNDYDLAPAGLARADRIGVVRAGAGEGHGVQHLARDALRRLPESKLYLS